MIDWKRHGITAIEWCHRKVEFNGRCAYCGKVTDKATVEHMIPLCRGGEAALSNVVPACWDCNRAKNTMTILEFLAGRRMDLGRPVKQKQTQRFTLFGYDAEIDGPLVPCA